MILSSFAKINLGLHIGKIRSDGFHEIETIIIFISLGDTVEISRIPRHEIVLSCNKNLCKPEENLAYKACKLIFDNFGVECGIKIKIRKNIPDGAGLGGGSSNAASVLYGLNKLLNLGISHNELIKFASHIGSDVPMFLSSGILKCSGRGEKINTICQNFPNCKILIKAGLKKISTKQAYQDFDLLDRKTENLEDLNKLERTINFGNINEISRNCFNDFEKITKVPVGWHLTGSGSATFKFIENSLNMKNKEILECHQIRHGTEIIEF